jgi:hypothetical protein
VAQHPLERCCLVAEVDRVAVDEGVVDDGFALLARLSVDPILTRQSIHDLQSIRRAAI